MVVTPTEYHEQVAFVNWLRAKGIAHWRTPNETFTKSWKQKTANKALGVSAGVCDLFVALPYVGLVGIEMKRTKGSVTSQAQKDWIALLNTIPNVEAHICKGADEAIAVITEILANTTPLPPSPAQTKPVNPVTKSKQADDTNGDLF